MPKAAIIPAGGIGDALLMLGAAYNLAQNGYEVTLFHEKLRGMARWFPYVQFSMLPFHGNYDLIILENDNLPMCRQIIAQYREKLSVFYPSYNASKHLPLHAMDKVFDGKLSMAENIRRATTTLLRRVCKKRPFAAIPSHLRKGRLVRQILIHPYSADPKKTWPLKKFQKVARILAKKGLEPKLVNTHGTLADFAADLYESAFFIGNDSMGAHLASLLGVDYLVVAKPAKNSLWRPDWHHGDMITPPACLPNLKGLRLRENLWHHFISPSYVAKVCFNAYCKGGRFQTGPGRER